MAEGEEGPCRDVVRRWMRTVDRAVTASIRAARENGSGSVHVDELAVLADKRATHSGWRLPGPVFDVVADRFHFLRSYGHTMSHKRIAALARKAYEAFRGDLGDDAPKVDFRASASWTAAFVKTMDLSYRRGTTKQVIALTARALEEAHSVYLARIAFTASRCAIPPELCFHADETGLMMLPSSNYTLAKRGSASVAVNDHDEKRLVTLMVAGNGAGDLLPPFVIFPRASNVLPAAPPGSGIEVASAASHWMSGDLLIDWVERVLVPAANRICVRTGRSRDHDILLSWDVYTSHRAESTLAHLKERHPRIKLVYVPSNCTSVAQVADVGINGPFKMMYRQLKEEWLVAETLGDDSFTVQRLPETDVPELDEAVIARMKKLRSLPLLRAKVLEWTARAWTKLEAKDVCKKAAEKAGFAVAVDPERNGGHLALARRLEDAGQLWVSRSRNDTVLERGEVATKPKTATKKPPRARASPSRCSRCHQAGHNARTCRRKRGQPSSASDRGPAPAPSIAEGGQGNCVIGKAGGAGELDSGPRKRRPKSAHLRTPLAPRPAANGGGKAVAKRALSVLMGRR